jgi:phasin family protein
MAVQAALVQPAIEKSVSYGRHLSDIANSTSAVFTKAVEGKMAESEQACQKPGRKQPEKRTRWL